MRPILLALLATLPLAAADGAAGEGRGERGAALFARLDANGDGSISREEFLSPRGHGDGHGKGSATGAARAKLLERWDTDKDGTLSESEKAAAKAAAQARKAEMLGKLDTDGDGKLSDAEKAAAREQAQAKRGEHFDRLDADRSGSLDHSEFPGRGAGKGEGGERGGKKDKDGASTLR